MCLKLLEGTILTNLAQVYAKQRHFADAEHAADRAWKLWKSSGHSEAAPFVWGMKAEIDYRRGALRAAATDLDNAFRGVNLKTTIAPFRDMHEIAYKVYRAEANAPLALAHLESFKRLDDEGRSLIASANLALLGAQFDFATQQLEIEHLKSALSSDPKSKSGKRSCHSMHHAIRVPKWMPSARACVN